jgi:hypothetical protein
MASITEAALRGAWFHTYFADEQQPNHTSSSYYVLLDGRVLANGNPAVTGTYAIVDGRVNITLSRVTKDDMTIVLQAADPFFDDTTERLQADATVASEANGEPLHLCGAFIRRTARSSAAGEFWRRVR